MTSNGWRRMKRLPCAWRGHGSLVPAENCKVLKRRRSKRERRKAQHQIRHTL